MLNLIGQTNLSSCSLYFSVARFGLRRNPSENWPHRSPDRDPAISSLIPRCALCVATQQSPVQTFCGGRTASAVPGIQLMSGKTLFLPSCRALGQVDEVHRVVFEIAPFHGMPEDQAYQRTNAAQRLRSKLPRFAQIRRHDSTADLTCSFANLVIRYCSNCGCKIGRILQ